MAVCEAEIRSEGAKGERRGGGCTPDLRKARHGPV